MVFLSNADTAWIHGSFAAWPGTAVSLYILLFLPLVVATTAKLTLAISEKTSAPIFACCLILLTPVIIKLSGIPLVDLTRLFFSAGQGFIFF